MDKYDLIPGMPWLEKHEPWIDWRGKAIGASRPAVSDRALFHRVEETKKTESAACVSSVGNRVPRGVKKTSTRAEGSSDNTLRGKSTLRVLPGATPSSLGQCHVFDGVSGRQVKVDAVHLEALPEVSGIHPKTGR
ncbi:Gag protein [Phytophthora palmivora]|uniref:Gag protein n=1 Tax=Phytophthora palmivora TaxID=4796 RepID=A0A2P4YH34_9STRA|nr:Gag protein [Phytophthora palmivora]